MSTRKVKVKIGVDAPTARRIAVAASVDPRTIQKVSQGKFVRGDAGYRAKLALDEYFQQERNR